MGGPRGGGYWGLARPAVTKRKHGFGTILGRCLSRVGASLAWWSGIARCLRVVRSAGFSMRRGGAGAGRFSTGAK